jgi:hypothetical protein
MLALIARKTKAGNHTTRIAKFDSTAQDLKRSLKKAAKWASQPKGLTLELFEVKPGKSWKAAYKEWKRETGGRGGTKRTKTDFQAAAIRHSGIPLPLSPQNKLPETTKQTNKKNK